METTIQFERPNDQLQLAFCKNHIIFERAGITIGDEQE